MRKLLFAFLALFLGVSSMSAQITTGETNSQVIRTGNRAKAGNWGLYLGATTDMFKNIGDGDISFSALPLINLKYMKTDQLEFRLGIEWWKKNDKDKQYNDEGEDDDVTSKNRESSFMFYPGVAYHFSNKNLLDVYVGGELPIGWNTKGMKVKYGDDESSDMARGFRVGLGAFIGLQAYIANLPLAIGVEYGVGTTYNIVNHGNFEDFNRSTGATSNAQFQDIANDLYENHQSAWKIGHQARFTISYYFNAK